MRSIRKKVRRLGKGGLGRAVLATLAIGVLAAPLGAVEGMGAHRGSGVILPYFSNTSSVITFYRFINAFALNESPWNGDVVDQREIWVHITYLTPDDTGGQCDELNSFFPMTRQDYYLLNVRSDSNSPAPFQEGYAVAWAVADDGGFPDNKIMHNHLAADQVTVDIANGAAWGVNAGTFRAATTVGPCLGPPPACGSPDDWFTTFSDGEEFAVLGIGGSPPLPPIQYEWAKFPENFFPTVMASNANISGARTLDGGTRYYVVPLSYDLESDRTILVPESLPPDLAYTNQYAFDVRLFDSDENRLSLPSQEVICWACLSAVDLIGQAGNQFLGSTSGLERWQGWIEFNSRGVQQLPLHAPTGTVTYFNRAAVVQVDQLRLGGDQVAWGFYPTHDRTTLDWLPVRDAENELNNGATDPDSQGVL